MASKTKSGILVANTTATVTLDKEYDRVEVVNRDGAAEIWFTTDGTDPTVGADDTYMLPAAIAVNVAPVSGSSRDGETVVKLKSTGTPTYYVEGQ